MNTHFAENSVAIAKGWQPVNGTFKADVEGAWTTFEPTDFQAMLDQLTEVLYSQAEFEGTEAAPASLAYPESLWSLLGRAAPASGSLHRRRYDRGS